MSIKALDWVLENSPAEGSARLVLVSLANHASGDGGNAYPSVETMRKEAGLASRRTVQNALRKLVELGAIEVEDEPGPRGVGRYRVLCGGGAQSTTGGGASDDIGGAQSTTGGGAIHDSRVYEPSLEPKEEPSNEPSEVEQVWQVWTHWLEVSGKTKQRLDDKRRRIIRDALRLVGIEAVKLALTGLSRSPHHRGENEQRRPYMEVRYALKGRGDESDDERIEKAITWAAQYAPEAQDVDPDKVQRWLEDLRYTASQPHHPERERGNEAYRKLRAAGFTVIKLDKAPWARIER